MTPDPRYPIGRPDIRHDLTEADRAPMIEQLAAMPRRLRAAIAGWDDTRLDTPYREDGWTVRQVVHHLADSHMNGYIRFKLTVTEENPTVRGYDQPSFAEQREAKHGDPELSLSILDALHRRWSTFLGHVPPEGWSRPLVYTDGRASTLNGLLCIYSWHGEHHIAHITELAGREGW